MDKIRSLLSIRRMDRFPNARIRELCRMAKGMDKRIEEDVLHRFSHVERMENDRIAMRLYVGECYYYYSPHPATGGSADNMPRKEG